MIEVLVDPGDGSGTFQPVSSNKVLQFFSDNTITSNGSLCFPSTDTDVAMTGTYSLLDSSISSPDCNLPITTPFEIQGSHLIVSYICFEACKAKFEKLAE